jgi:hypothetical protein
LWKGQHPCKGSFPSPNLLKGRPHEAALSWSQAKRLQKKLWPEKRRERRRKKVKRVEESEEPFQKKK